MMTTEAMEKTAERHRRHSDLIGYNIWFAATQLSERLDRLTELVEKVVEQKEESPNQ